MYGDRDFLTIHLNDYFQCGASRGAVPERFWNRFETRIEGNTLRLLDALEHRSIQATFFSSGWIADQFPDLLAEIAGRGHEVASTGYYQRIVRNLDREEFRAEVVQARLALERACGREVLGYRCAGWLRPTETWPLEILAEEGVRYDSSMAALGPATTRPASEAPYTMRFGGRTIWEVPVPSAAFLGLRFPIAGGTYLRQLPDAMLRRLVEQWHHERRGPWQIYFHVSELDAGQPRITALSRARSIQKYRNLHAMETRVFDYLDRYSFTSIGEGLGLAPRPVASDRRRTADPDVPAPPPGAGALPLTIVVPCYQEQDSVPYLANALRAFRAKHAALYDVSCVLVDDGSEDRTHERLLAAFGADPKATVLRHTENRGVTAAIMTGIRAAPSEVVGVIDSDCSYSPETLARLLPALGEDVALVTASPYHPEGVVVNVPAWRLALSRGLSAIYRRLLTTQIATYTSCCRIYRRSAVTDLPLHHDDFLGMSEIIVRLDERGAKIVEVPAVLEARVLGSSKMKTMRTVIAHGRAILDLMARRRRARIAPAIE